MPQHNDPVVVVKNTTVVFSERSQVAAFLYILWYSFRSSRPCPYVHVMLVQSQVSCSHSSSQ